MINDCIDSNEVFGINLFAERKLYMIGCSAIVYEIIDRKPGGEMNIISKGVGRYTVINYETSSDGFYKGNVNFIENENKNYDKTKMKEVVQMYNEIVQTVYKETVKQIDPDDIKWQDGSRSVSFLMSEKCGLNLFERQNMLELKDEDDRLDYILKYFKEVMPKIKEANRVNKIIKSDGYIQ